jgi:hypothetical protein
MLDGEPACPRHADGIDAGVIIKAFVLDADHRILHHLRDLIDGEPAAETGAERYDYGAVRRMDADHLAVGRGLEAFVGRQGLHRHDDRSHQRDKASRRRESTDLEQADEPESHALRLRHARSFRAVIPICGLARWGIRRKPMPPKQLVD